MNILLKNIYKRLKRSIIAKNWNTGKKRINSLTILILIYIFSGITMALAEKIPYKGEIHTDAEYNFSAYLPNGWDKEIEKRENALRIELFSSPMTFIITEVYKNFDKSLIDYKNIIWRRQKIKFHTLEKITDRAFKKDDRESFLLISRFHHRGRSYLQRTYGRRIGNSAYVANFIAPKNQFYKKMNIFDGFVSRFRLNADEILSDRKDDKKDVYDESKYEEKKEEKSAKDLNMENMKEDSEKNGKDSAKKGEFTLLPDGSWGYGDK